MTFVTAAKNDNENTMKRNCFISLIALALASSRTFATPTQDEVFKSISNSVGEKQNSETLLFVVIGGVLLIAAMAIINRLTNRPAAAKSVNSPGKLMKELAARAELRPAEVRQLKLLGESADLQPITMLLCPSAFAKAVQKGPTKLDRKVIANLVRRLQTDAT